MTATAPATALDSGPGLRRNDGKGNGAYAGMTAAVLRAAVYDFGKRALLFGLSAWDRICGEGDVGKRRVDCTKLRGLRIPNVNG
jgi:hypothetical protein